MCGKLRTGLTVKKIDGFSERKKGRLGCGLAKRMVHERNEL